MHLWLFVLDTIYTGHDFGYNFLGFGIMEFATAHSLNHGQSQSSKRNRVQFVSSVAHRARTDHMPKTKSKRLTWDKHGKRWKKTYQGNTFYGERGVQKSDPDAYKAAWKAFEIWRGNIDTQPDTSKPHAADYLLAINVREEMMRICLLEGEEALHDKLLGDVGWLKKNLAKKTPPPLRNKQYPGVDTLDQNPTASMTASEASKWQDRIAALRQQDRWMGADAKERTVGANIEKHLAARLLDAQAGQIADQRYENIRNWLTIFKEWLLTNYGELPVEQLSSATMTAYREHLLTKISDGEYSKSYARSILNEAKFFCNWLNNTDTIDRPIKNLRGLNIDIDIDPESRHLTTDEVKNLLTHAEPSLKLYILLMLQTGSTQKDIADLKQSEVDWEQGVA